MILNIRRVNFDDKAIHFPEKDFFHIFFCTNKRMLSLPNDWFPRWYLGVSDTQIDSIFEFCPQIIQFNTFHKNSIQTIIQFKKIIGDPIQLIIQFKCQGIINTARIRKVADKCLKCVHKR